MEAHARDFRSEAEDPAKAERLKSGWREALLTPREQALCAYAEKLTRAPWTMRREDLDPLRAHGLDDAAILDLVQVVSYFNYINRVADALGVPPEPDWE